MSQGPKVPRSQGPKAPSAHAPARASSARQCKKPPGGGLRRVREPFYFGAAEAALIAEVAALFADEAASAAAVAAVLADIAAEALASADGVVTTVVVDVAGGVGAIVAGGVTVVVVSSFLLHAANETAAARVTISSAVFMFLLDFKFGQSPVFVGILRRGTPSSARQGKLQHFQCLTGDYRRLRCFP